MLEYYLELDSLTEGIKPEDISYTGTSLTAEPTAEINEIAKSAYMQLSSMLEGATFTDLKTSRAGLITKVKNLNIGSRFKAVKLQGKNGKIDYRLGDLPNSKNYAIAATRGELITMPKARGSKGIWPTGCLKLELTVDFDGATEIFKVYRPTSKNYKFDLAEGQDVADFTKIYNEANAKIQEKMQSSKYWYLYKHQWEEHMSDRAEAAQERKEQRIKELMAFNPENITTEYDIREAMDFWFAIGWLARHGSSPRASVPEELDSTFTANFGEQAKRSVVPADYVSPAGGTRGGYSFSMAVDNMQNLPPYLAARYSGHTIISDVNFIWQLVRDLGFEFGVKPDYNKIKPNVPEEYLEDFEAGYNN